MMTIELVKKKRLYIFNLNTVDITNEILSEFSKLVNSIKARKARIALNLDNVTLISATNFVKFLYSKDINLVMPNSYILAYLSMTTRGLLPPIFLSENDLFKRTGQFVKRNFALA